MSNIELLADSRAEAINGGLNKLKITKPKIAVQTNVTGIDGNVSGGTFNQTNTATF
jgi:hypothetical protein